MLRELFASTADAATDGVRRLPEECAAHVWSYLSMTELVRASAISPAARRGAPAIVQLAGSLHRLGRGLKDTYSKATIYEIRGLTALAGNSRAHIWPYFSNVVALLRALVRSPNSCMAVRRQVLGCIGWLLGNPRRLCEVFLECDCDTGEPPVLDPTLELLSWAASRDSFRLGAVEVLVGIARAILTGVQEAECTAATGTGSGCQASASSVGPWVAAWAERRAVQHQVASFNRNPEAWWHKVLKSSGANLADTVAARFILHNRAALDGTQVGDFMSKHKEVTTAYIRQFPLKSLGVVQAFSRVLRGLQVPREAQQVDRFCESFGAAWGAANGLDQEAAHVFAFSVVMLSTDLHRPAARGHERMSFAQFERSLRGALGKTHLNERMIREAYDTVKADPMWMCQRVGNAVGEGSPLDLCSQLRHTVCKRSPPVPRRMAMAGSKPNVQGMWRALWSSVWGPLLGAFSAGAHGAGNNEALREQALRGLQLCCQTAALLGEVDHAQAFSTAMQQLCEAH